MTNLLNYVKDNLSEEVISKVGSFIGENTATTKSAITAALPTVLKGIINRGDSKENVKSLREFMSLEGTNKKLISDLLSADTKVAKDSYIAKGGRVVEYLFGKSKRNLLGNIEKGVGLKEAKSTTLTNALAPLALASINQLAAKENYTDAQLSQYLHNQKAFLSGTTERVVNTTKEKVGRKEPLVEKAKASTHTEQSSGMGWLAWLLPLLLIGGLIWWFMGRNTATTRTQTKETTSAPATKKTPTTTNTATADNAFSNLFSKVGSIYSLSGITFDDASQKITNFSATEMESLVKALIAAPTAKVQVQAHATGGEDVMQVTTSRAQLVHDMLVRLGVDDGQISFKGMGNGDAAKSAKGKIDIMVEQIVK